MSNNTLHQHLIDILDESVLMPDLEEPSPTLIDYLDAIEPPLSPPLSPPSSPPSSPPLSPPLSPPSSPPPLISIPSDSEWRPSNPPPHPPPSPMLSVTGHGIPAFNALSQLNLNLPYLFPPNTLLNNPFHLHLPFSPPPALDFLNQQPLNHAVAQTMFQSLGDESPYKQVASRKGLAQLKYVYFDDETCETKNCPISGDEFEEGERIVILPCEHTFSEDAIMRWITEENASCPVCRFQLEAKEVRIEADEEAGHALPASPNQQPEAVPPFADLVNALQRSYDQFEEEQLQSAILNSLQS